MHMGQPCTNCNFGLVFAPCLLSSVIMDFDKEIDLSGLNCPLPILRTKKALAELQSGQVLKVWATDPATPKDFDAFARQTGNALLQSSNENDKFVFFLRRK